MRRCPESCEVEMSNWNTMSMELHTSSGEPRRSDKRCGCYTTMISPMFNTADPA